MRKILTTTTLVASVMLAGAAIAQTTPAKAPAAPLAATGSVTTGTTVDTQKLIGRKIKDGSDDTVGDIDSVLIDESGNVQYVVIGVGGFLGMGEKQVALPWDALTITENGAKVTVNSTKEQLKALPEYRYGEASRRGTVYSYNDGLKTNPHLATTPTTSSMSSTSTSAGTATPPLPGSNSFTEGQARARIEADGYTAVSNLKKDEQSIWRGTATKDGKSVSVALDYKGNIVAR